MGLSPMMKHYISMKEAHPNEILFYRLGDFYEMFFDDAITVSRELELTLTGKDCGLEERAPMCGLPYHAADGYIAKLIEKGYRVAICEQVSDPKQVAAGKLVERAVVKIVTAGTAIEDEVLVPTKNNYLACVYTDKNKTKFGVAWSDISTGSLEVCEISGLNSIKLLEDTLVRIRPSEIIGSVDVKQLCSSFYSVGVGFIPNVYAFDGSNISFSKAEKMVKKQFNISSLQVFDAQNLNFGIIAVGGLLAYLENTQMRFVSNIKKMTVVKDENYVHLDVNTRKNLELTQGTGFKKNQGSLLHLLDKTKTAMGSRKLRSFIEKPLRDSIEINARLDAVEELTDDIIMREELIDLMSCVLDIERKCSKISAGTINPKECLSLSDTLKKIPEIKSTLSNAKCDKLINLNKSIFELYEISGLIDDAIAPDAPAITKDGGYIKNGYSSALDTARTAGQYGVSWLAEFEQSEKEKTGIKNLKTGYNRVFGYYIEVTNSQLSLVPDYYIRKQTTTNSERYITPELKDMEYKILNSHEESMKIESEIYADIKNYLNGFVDKLLETANAIAELDALLSFAVVSSKNGYIKPVINDSTDKIKIIGGRHPVIEELIEGGTFSPNDTNLDTSENRTMLITGPNMAGKSTYMRQVAIITLMAHMGCFVPADAAEIAIVDRVFTRVGASDDLAFGQSTFMVEMTEVANIVQNATDKSLIILDEVGRGTSTYDGLSIAWAIMEYLSKHLKAKTLFATHYHELCDLEGKVDGVKNYRVMVKELGDTVIFLHKIARGSANRSFGIEVASLAGLPEELITRARDLLSMIENGQKPLDNNVTEIKSENKFNYDEVINVLKEMDMNTITPLMAFGTLQNLVDKVKK